MIRITPLAAAFLATIAVPAAAAPLGSDAAACEANKPAVLATITGLKDRTGTVRLELYPATEADFKRDDHALIAEGKTFRRVKVTPPPAGPVALCVKVPAPGRYALLLIHNRNGQNKFDYRVDGAGVPSNRKLGLSSPGVDKAIITVGDATLPLTIRTQYLGLLGFSPRSGS